MPDVLEEYSHRHAAFKNRVLLNNPATLRKRVQNYGGRHEIRHFWIQTGLNTRECEQKYFKSSARKYTKITCIKSCQDDFFNPPPIFLHIITSTLPSPELSPRRCRPAARGAMAPLIRRRLLVVAVLLPVLAVAALPAAAAAASCKAWLVQSIPTDMPHLRRVPGVLSTGMLPSVFCHIERWREGVTF
jgi:hypothetical protein